MTETECYHADGYVALPGLFPGEVLTSFYEQMWDALTKQHGSMNMFRTRGPLFGKDAIEVYSMQYAPMQTFLWGLTPRVAEAAGRSLLPSYAYFRLYQEGDICRVHSDRQACEHSLSLTMLYSDGKPWPLSVSRTELSAPSAAVSGDFGEEPFGSVAMQPGDGVLYQGTHHRHGRLDPNPNRWSAHMFLHWVEASGRYADHAFDRRAIDQASAQRL